MSDIFSNNRESFYAVKDCADHHQIELTRLRTELAAEREQTAGLAAALEAVRMHVRDQYIHFPGHGTLTIGEYIDKHDTRAILAARDADQRRKGAAWALRQIGCTCPWAGRGTHDEECVLTLLAAIERGEVEVGE